jgi:hypothetical protein
LVNAGATVEVATAMSLVDEQRELLLGLRGLGAQAEFLLDGSLAYDGNRPSQKLGINAGRNIFGTGLLVFS